MATTRMICHGQRPAVTSSAGRPLPPWPCTLAHCERLLHPSWGLSFLCDSCVQPSKNASGSKFSMLQNQWYDASEKMMANMVSTHSAAHGHNCSGPPDSCPCRALHNPNSVLTICFFPSGAAAPGIGNTCQVRLLFEPAVHHLPEPAAHRTRPKATHGTCTGIMPPQRPSVCI